MEQDFVDRICEAYEEIVWPDGSTRKARRDSDRFMRLAQDLPTINGLSEISFEYRVKRFEEYGKADDDSWMQEEPCRSTLQREFGDRKAETK